MNNRTPDLRCDACRQINDGNMFHEPEGPTILYCKHTQAIESCPLCQGKIPPVFQARIKEIQDRSDGLQKDMEAHIAKIERELYEACCENAQLRQLNKSGKRLIFAKGIIVSDQKLTQSKCEGWPTYPMNQSLLEMLFHCAELAALKLLTEEPCVEGRGLSVVVELTDAKIKKEP